MLKAFAIGFLPSSRSSSGRVGQTAETGFQRLTDRISGLRNQASRIDFNRRASKVKVYRRNL